LQKHYAEYRNDKGEYSEDLDKNEHGYSVTELLFLLADKVDATDSYITLHNCGYQTDERYRHAVREYYPALRLGKRYHVAENVEFYHCHERYDKPVQTLRRRHDLQDHGVTELVGLFAEQRRRRLSGTSYAYSGTDARNDNGKRRAEYGIKIAPIHCSFLLTKNYLRKTAPVRINP